MGKRSSAGIRFIDRYVGIPLLILLRMGRPLTRPLFRKNVCTAEGLTKVGIVKISALGDTVLMEPTVTALLRRGYCVTLYLGGSNYGFAKIIFAHYTHDAPHSDAPRTHDAPHTHDAPRTHDGKLHIKRLDKKMLLRLLAGRYKEQLVFDLGQWTRIEAVIAMLIRANKRYGFRTPHQYKHLAFDAYLDHDPYKHELRHYLDLIALAGVPHNHSRAFPVIPMLPPWAAPIATSQPYIVFAMFSGTYNSYMREWLPRRWKELSILLQQDGFDVIIVGTEGDSKTDAYGSFIRFIHSAPSTYSGTQVIDLVGRTTLSEFVGIIANSELVVSVDTGAAHIAGALGKKVVAMHGASYIERWGALGANGMQIALIQADVPCIGCSSIGSDYRCNNPICMENISVATIYSISYNLLNRV